MDLLMVIGGIAAATASGLGLRLGARLLPAGLGAYRDLVQWKKTGASIKPSGFAGDEQFQQKLIRPVGRKRDSSIVGIHGEALRHTDGSYTRAYTARLEPTMLADDSVIDMRYDEIARMLAAPKPPGTLIQFRFSSGPDPGRAIDAHFKAYNGTLTHPEASLLHAMNLDYYQTAASARAYRHEVLTLWVRVPVRQTGDATSVGLSAFIPALGNEIKKHGLTNIPGIVRHIWNETADDGVVRRIIDDEREAFEKAEKVFRLVERECPLAMRRLSCEELWEAVYLGHR